MDKLIPLLLFAFSTTLTPGPNNFMIMNSGLNFGIKPSLGHYFGIALGFPIMLLMVALGLGVVFVKFLWIKQVLQVVGSIYMLYLAWKILRSHSKSNSVSLSKPLTFFQAFLFQWVNPKAWIMAVGTISIFTLNNNYFLNAFLLCLITFLVCIPATAVWLLFGKILQRILKNDKQRAWFNLGMAITLVASIALIFIE